jgi:hypothetical protein
LANEIFATNKRRDKRVVNTGHRLYPQAAASLQANATASRHSTSARSTATTIWRISSGNDALALLGDTLPTQVSPPVSGVR